MELGQESEQQPERPDTELPEDNDGALDFIRAVGKQFKAARERAGLTQQEVAVRLNYGVDLISSVERGRRVPQPELLVAADRLFGLDGVLAAAAEDLVGGEAQGPDAAPGVVPDLRPAGGEGGGDP